MATRAVLPPRPLTISASFVSRIWFNAIGVGMLGLAVIAITLGVAGGTAADILRQRKIAKRGVAAPYTSISGKVKTTNIVYHEHDLTVTFQEEGGATHTEKMSFSTLFLSADKNLQPQVWYDPVNPKRFALNLATERAGSRWLLLLFAVGIFGGTGVGILYGARSFVRRLANTRTIAARSEEIRVDIVGVEEIRNQKGAPTGRKRWHWKGQTAAGRAISGSTDFDKGHGPLYGDAAERTMVALYSSELPNAAATMVMRDDLHPFVFDAAERERIRREATAPELGVG